MSCTTSTSSEIKVVASIEADKSIIHQLSHLKHIGESSCKLLNMISSEQDPLLPRDKSAPEISYSQDEIRNLYSEGASDEEAEIEAVRRRRGLTDIIALASLFITVAIFYVLFWSTAWDHSGEGPSTGLKTIEQRVNKILSTTPLIGI